MEKHQTLYGKYQHLVPKTDRLQYYSKNMLPNRTIINSLTEKVLGMHDAHVQKVSQLGEAMNDVAHFNISPLEHAKEKKSYSQLGNKILKDLVRETEQATNPSPNHSTNLTPPKRSDQVTLRKEKISLKSQRPLYSSVAITLI